MQLYHFLTRAPLIPVQMLNFQLLLNSHAKEPNVKHKSEALIRCSEESITTPRNFQLTFSQHYSSLIVEEKCLKVFLECRSKNAAGIQERLITFRIYCKPKILHYHDRSNFIFTMCLMCNSACWWTGGSMMTKKIKWNKPVILERVDE